MPGELIRKELAAGILQGVFKELSNDGETPTFKERRLPGCANDLLLLRISSWWGELIFFCFIQRNR